MICKNRNWIFQQMLSQQFQASSIRDLSRGEAERRIRARCVAHYLGDHEILCRCLGQFKMFVDSRDVGFASHIIMDGFWEFWITQFIAAELKEGAIALDVGANFGYYTLLMSELIGPSGRCIAVEPNAEVAAKLRKTISVNGFERRAILHEVALGRVASGQTSLFIPYGEPKNAAVVRDDAQADSASGRIVRVKQATVDSICADLSRLDFIKIDAEGAEADIVEGMTRVIARFEPSILLEFNAARGYDVRELIGSLFHTYGMLRYVDFDGGLKPVTLERLETEHVGQDWMLYFSR